MDRGFGSFRGNSGFVNERDRYSRDERRYDDFYDNNRRTGGGGGNRNINRSTRGGNQRNWSGSPKDRNFNQGNNRGNAGAQMLASLQQQQLLSAFMHSSNVRSGILNTPQRFQGNRGPRGPRVGDKRRMDYQNQSGMKRNRPAVKKNAPAKKVEVREPSPEIPDEDVVIPDTLMDSIETLRQRTDIERNVADEDVKKLLIFSYNGKGYNCLTCGMFFSTETGFLHHLMGKTHVMNVIAARTAKKYQPVRDILDIDLASDDWYENSEKAREVLHKQAKTLMKTQMLKEKREKENYDKTPGNFFEIKMETRKTANKTGDSVTITSVNESLIEIKEFSKDRFFGCEFVKAVTGFQCRLCNLHLKDAAAVIPHVDGRVHRNNYQVHLKKNKDYEKVQTEQNKELIEVLTQYEDTDVLLFETTKAKEMKFLAKLDENIVRDEKLLNPPEKKPKVEEKKDKDEEKTDEDKEAADGDEKAEDDEENKEDDEEATEEDQEANEGEEEEEEEASEEVNGEEEVEEEAEVEAEEEEAEAEAEEEENDAEEKAEEEEEEEEVEEEEKKRGS